MIKLISIFLFIVLFSAIYQDFPLFNLFGEIARSPVVFLTPLMVVYLINLKKITVSNYSKLFILYFLYLLLISIIYTLFFYFRVGDIVLLNENIFLKSIKMLMYPAVGFVVYLFICNYLKSNRKHIYTLAKQVYFIQLLLLFVLIIESQQKSTGLTIFQALHSSQELYWRVRLLTLESSWTGSIAIIFSLLPIYFAVNGYLTYKKGIVYLTSFIFLLIYTYFSESKGYLLLFVISVLPNVIKALSNNKYKKYLLPVSIASIAIISVVFTTLYNNMIVQLYSSITFGTRFSSYLASFRSFIIHPFGVGTGPYMYYYTESLKSILGSGWMNVFNLKEVKQYVNTSQALSTKTYFLDQLIYGGIGFLTFFYYFFYKRFIKLSKNKSNQILKIILLFIILSGSTYITYHIKYEVWIFLAIIDYIENNKQTPSYV